MSESGRKRTDAHCDHRALVYPQVNGPTMVEVGGGIARASHRFSCRPVPEPVARETYLLPNITFTYTGSQIMGAADVMGFEAISTDALSNTAIKDGVAQTTLSSGGSTASINAVLVSGAPVAIPEPSSLLTVGSGVLLAAWKVLQFATRRQ